MGVWDKLGRNVVIPGQMGRKKKERTGMSRSDRRSTVPIFLVSVGNAFYAFRTQLPNLRCPYPLLTVNCSDSTKKKYLKAIMTIL